MEASRRKEGSESIGVRLLFFLSCVSSDGKTNEREFWFEILPLGKEEQYQKETKGKVARAGNRLRSPWTNVDNNGL